VAQELLLGAVAEKAAMKLAASYMALGMLFCVGIEPARSQPRDESNVLPPLGHTLFCLQYEHDCARTQSTEAMPTSPEGRWRKMELINTSVNATIARKLNADPAKTSWRLAPQEGNCNDYAVTKRHELLKAGWPSSSLLLAEVTLISSGEHHLILIVKGDQTSWALDNLRDTIVTVAAAQYDYVLKRIESSEDPRFWTSSYGSWSAPIPAYTYVKSFLGAAAERASTTSLGSLIGKRALR
jgi:predicted transglutaminase-like cysteine proteinase